MDPITLEDIPFVEGPANVSILADYLITTLPQVLPCDDSTLATRIQEDVATQDHLGAVGAAAYSCLQDFDTKAVRMATEAREGDAHAVYSHYRLAAEDRLNQSRTALSDVPIANVVEAEVLGVLMLAYLTADESIRTAEGLFEAWKTHDRPIDLRNTFNQFAWIADITHMLDLIVRTYPWAEGRCEVSGEHLAGIKVLSADVSEAGSRHASPAEADFVSTRHGRHVKLAVPFMERALATDWWPVALHLGAVMALDLRYWQDHDEDLPSNEEALETMKLQRTRHRSLVSEYELARIESIIVASVNGGYDDPIALRQARNVDALRYAHEAIDCRSPHTG